MQRRKKSKSEEVIQIKFLNQQYFLKKKYQSKKFKRTTNKKTPINMSARGEAKNELISFFEYSRAWFQ